MTYGQVLEALADPTRRSLFERLRHRPHTVGELATLAGVRQPTVSQHLRVLREAQLVQDRQEGTRRFYTADRTGLVALREYVESFWDDVLTAFASGDPRPPARARHARAAQGGQTKRRKR
jgi:DNA-binding transcriptional ArsR family regulator